MWWSVFNFSEIQKKKIMHLVLLGIIVKKILTLIFFQFYFYKNIRSIRGKHLGFCYFSKLELILIVFSHIEQNTSDYPCIKYGLEYVFINLNLKLRTQIVTFKVIKIQILFICFFKFVFHCCQIKQRLYNNVLRYISCSLDIYVCFWQEN